MEWTVIISSASARVGWALPVGVEVQGDVVFVIKHAKLDLVWGIERYSHFTI